MNNIRVSVVMGVYNEKLEWLKECVDSVLNQTYKGFEFVIVLDNPSNTILKKYLVDLEKKDNRIKLLINKKNIGIIDSANRGIEFASGEYIARMDADDICTNNRLQEQLEFLDDNPKIHLVGSKMIFIDENGNKLYEDKYKLKDFNQIREHIKYCSALSQPTFMFRKKTIVEIGGYRNAYCAEDYDLCMRLVERGYEITNIQKVLVYYRVRANGISVGKRRYQLTATVYLQKKYVYYLKNNIDLFNEKELQRLMKKDDTKLGTYIEKLNIRADKNKHNKIKRLTYISMLFIISNKYRIYYIHRFKLKLYLKKIDLL